MNNASSSLPNPQTAAPTPPPAPSDAVPKDRDPSEIDPAVWASRLEELRQQEWQMALRLLALGRACLHRVALRLASNVSVSDIARIFDLASHLGRRAAGFRDGHLPEVIPADNPLSLDVKAALDKIYGPSLPGEEPEEKPDGGIAAAPATP